MDISDCAHFYDDQPVLDGYSLTQLFLGQSDLYDATESDSETAWRRSVSAAAVTLPARGVVKLGDIWLITGRIVQDFFQGEVIRENLLLHPCDGLFELGTADKFLADTARTSLYAGASWRKELKEEGESSQLFNLYSIFMSSTESPVKDQLLKSPEGRYFRIQNVEETTGELKAAVSADLGVGVLSSVSYTATTGVYDSATDSSGTSAPISVQAIIERYQSNYRYLNRAAAKYERGDKVFTVLQSVVTDPKPDDHITVGSEVYRVLGAQSDGASSWELHGRPFE